jgi:hypothetical protein
MRRLSATIPLLAATTLFGAPAFAHHSQAMFDTSQEILIEGTVARFVMRANPNRGGWGKQVRILDVTTQDGEIHPFYAANTVLSD